MSAADVVKSHMSMIDAALDPLTPAEAERFAAIMGACPDYWPWWRSMQYHGGNWDRPCDVTFIIDDPAAEGDVIVKRLTAKQVVRALGTAVRTVPSMQHIDPYDTDSLDLDAGDADCVLQIAVLGDVVYG